MRFNVLAAAAMVVLVSMVAPAQAESDVAFAYQGRVKVQGQPFTGTGQFKFSIVDTNGNTTLWSNDGTGASGAAPTGYLSLPVQDGIFNVIVGDTSAGMVAINSTIFNSQTPLKLRVWFNDGTRGFQQLNPDHTLVNLALNVLETGTQDFTIYVNGSTGNDTNNGLTSSTPKKTIQSAVDSLPDRVNCNITVDIADGVYREEVIIHGISVATKKKLTLLGDESWTPSSAGDPAVVISGADAAAPTTPVRDYAFNATQCSGVELKGIHFTRALLNGLHVENGLYTVKNCKASYNIKHGFEAIRQTQSNYTDCVATYNDSVGFNIMTASRGTLLNCQSTYNGAYGAQAFNQSQCNIDGTGTYSNNGRLVQASGVRSGPFCDVGFNWGTFTGNVNNNNGYGLEAYWHGYIIYSTTPGLTVSGNTLGRQATGHGGVIYN